jgi:hypothetical protein
MYCVLRWRGNITWLRWPFAPTITWHYSRRPCGFTFITVVYSVIVDDDRGVNGRPAEGRREMASRVRTVRMAQHYRRGLRTAWWYTRFFR